MPHAGSGPLNDSSNPILANDKGSSRSFCTSYFTTLFYWWLQKQNTSFFFIITLLSNTFFQAPSQLLNVIIILWRLENDHRGRHQSRTLQAHPTSDTKCDV
jgi:hypothetical protein